MKDSDHIALDLDGTLAEYHGFKGAEHIGDPIPSMLDRLKGWLNDGKKVSIFTARADKPENIPPIRAWLKKHVGQELPVTNIKRPQFTHFYDDRAVGVEKNTGRLILAKKHARRMAVQ